MLKLESLKSSSARLDVMVALQRRSIQEDYIVTVFIFIVSDDALFPFFRTGSGFAVSAVQETETNPHSVFSVPAFEVGTCIREEPLRRRTGTQGPGC